MLREIHNPQMVLYYKGEEFLHKNKDIYPPFAYLPLLDIIDVEPLGFDEIQAKTDMNTEELLKTLTIMELEGLIEQTDGDRYKRT